jgi:hypothetical protein
MDRHRIAKRVLDGKGNLVWYLKRGYLVASLLLADAAFAAGMISKSKIFLSHALKVFQVRS